MINKGQEQEGKVRNKHADCPNSLHSWKDAEIKNYWISKNIV